MSRWAYVLGPIWPTHGLACITKQYQSQNFKIAFILRALVLHQRGPTWSLHFELLKVEIVFLFLFFLRRMAFPP